MNLLKSLPLSLSVLSALWASAIAQAADDAIATQTLQSVQVNAKRNRTQSTVEHKNQEAIQREMIHDMRDLVRYSADVGVAENGRRMKGFAMRGVEDNRVGISIDGVPLPDSEDNSLYARYGNFNNSRLSIDSELVRNIEMTKGADSFASGSGALGGNVNYRTLNASDLLLPERTFGGLFKSGYASRNREWVNTLGLGFQNQQFDAALLYSHRHGHEQKSHLGQVNLYRASKYDSDYDIQRRAEIGSARIYPDPSSHRNHSYLAKFGWQFTPNQKIGMAFTKQDARNQIHELSYALERSWRDAQDQQKRNNTNLYYEWTPESSPIALVRADLDWQKTENSTLNNKGDYDQKGTWQTGYTYEKGRLANLDLRKHINKMQQGNLRLDSKTLHLGDSTHQLSLKWFAGKRTFQNRNTDSILDPEGKITQTDTYTIQYPIKTKQYGAALSDTWTWHRLSGFAGLRYDRTRLQPETLSLPCGKKSGSFGRLCAEVDPQGATFHQWNGALGVNWQMNDAWQLGYQASTGYRVPTASELYFSFESPFGNWLANPHLKAERGLNHNIILQGRGKIGHMNVNLYQTNYKDFLFEQETTLEREDPTCDEYAQYYTDCTGKRTDYFQQMVNLDKAKIRGLAFSGSLKLDELGLTSKGWQLSGSIGYSKGQLSGEQKVSLLSIQPFKAVIGLDYQSPSGKWGIFSRTNFMGAKKAKDAQIAEMTGKGCHRYKIDPWTGEPKRDYYTDELICDAGQEYYFSEVKDFRWLNQRAWTFDLFGYYRPVKNLTFRAGVYNLFNTRYHTWDTLRGINPRSTINTLSVSKPEFAQQGLNRYYAPKRHFAASVEYRF